MKFILFEQRCRNGKNSNPARWLKWRTFPPTRVNANELLAALGLNSYNRWAIVRKTHGVMADDEIWLRFKGEILEHRDVTLRKSLYYPDDKLNEKIMVNYSS